MPIYAISVSSLTPKMARLGFDSLAETIAKTAKLIEAKLF
jgi:IclR family transcriptional regulator, carbohydrate utilization repressor